MLALGLPSMDLACELRSDRFFVHVPVKGKRLLFFTDTGGGQGVYRDVADSLGLEVSPLALAGGKTADMASLGTVAGGFPLPAAYEGRFFVWKRDADMPLEDDCAGMLGSNWFADRVWTLDYPKARFAFEGTSLSKPPRGAVAVPMGFRTAEGHRVGNVPTIPVEIDGRALTAHLDTGASTRLTPEAQAAVGDGRPAVRAASFVAESVYEAWHRDHPEWRVVPKGERYGNVWFSMIEVPRVRIAGSEVGPVWFTWRREQSLAMLTTDPEHPCRLAVGGNVLRGFRLTLDYPGAVAYFGKPSRRR